MRTDATNTSNSAEAVLGNYMISKDGEIVHKTSGKCPECKQANHFLNVQLVNVFQAVLPEYLKERGRFHELPNCDRQFYASHSWDTAEEDNRPLLVFLAGPRVRYKPGVLNVRVLLEKDGGLQAATIIGYMERCLQLGWHFITLSPLQYNFASPNLMDCSESQILHFLTTVVLPSPDEEGLIICRDPKTVATKRFRPVFIVAHGLTGPALLYPLRPSPADLYRAVNLSLEEQLQQFNNNQTTEDTFVQDLNAYCLKHFSSSSTTAEGGLCFTEDGKQRTNSGNRPSAPGRGVRLSGNGQESLGFASSAETPKQNSSSVYEERVVSSECVPPLPTETRSFSSVTRGSTSTIMLGNTVHASAKATPHPLHPKYGGITRIMQETDGSTRIWNEHLRIYLKQLDRQVKAIIFIDSVVDLHSLPITDKDALLWIQRHSIHYLPSKQSKGTRIPYMKDIATFSGGSIDSAKLPRLVLDDIILNFYKMENPNEGNFQLPPLDFEFLNSYVSSPVKT